jgi:DNA helicase-2/ATP-dependent DNA helicase PcrA
MPSQFDALLSSNAALLCVIAAPGSGKTSHLLIPKTRDLLDDLSIDPEEVLLLSFSRLSAQDLKAKVKKFDRTPRATTVHSAALSFLISEDNHEIRARVESIMLDFEKETLLADLKALFPKRHKNDLRKDLRSFSAGWATQPHDNVFEENDEKRAFKHAVVNWLAEHRAAMMEEILYFAVDLAKKNPGATHLAKAKYILVDEYQDLNKLEQEFIDALTTNATQTVVVGDPDQSIYSFKFAHPHGIISFSTRPGVDNHTGLTTWRCPRKVVYYANQLLQQIDPARTALLTTQPAAIDGDVAFIRKNVQEEEFEFVLSSIAQRLANGVVPKNIIVLVPRKKLGVDFVAYATAHQAAAGIAGATTFCFTAKADFTPEEQERILLLGLMAKPGSLLHARTYIGLPDEKEAFAKELLFLKHMFGTLEATLATATEEAVPPRKKKARAAAARIESLRAFHKAHEKTAASTEVIDELFPQDMSEVATVRSMLLGLLEDGDSVSQLYSKFVDYIRTIPERDQQIRVMTLMGSKGLEADHVYIQGCNAGNIPGDNYSSHMSPLEHRHEQIRLLYVGFTRAQQSLTVSWSQFLPFAQSKGHHTPGVATMKYKGQTVAKVGMCHFIQDLHGVIWQ